MQTNKSYIKYYVLITVDFLGCDQSVDSAVRFVIRFQQTLPLDYVCQSGGISLRIP